MQQDSSEPTGVASTGNDKAAVRRARERKALAALELKMAGATYEQIAQTLGYPTPRAALLAVEKMLEKRILTESDRDRLRALAGARLERLTRSVWEKAIDPRHPEQLQAAGKAREFIADWRKLYGLDAPTEVVVHNPTLQEIESFVSRVIGASAPPVEEADILELEAGEYEEEVADAVSADS